MACLFLSVSLTYLNVFRKQLIYKIGFKLDKGVLLMNYLLKLIEKGQSYWIDNLTRKMITSGELERRKNNDGLRGITSNPAIFHKAITASHDYDEQISELVNRQSPLEKIYEELVTTDVRDACDVLRPVYDESPVAVVGVLGPFPGHHQMPFPYQFRA